MNNYRNINSVEELKTIYNINESIVVEKKGDGKADENVKQTTFLKDKLKVEYADLKEVSNIFKHIIVFTNDRDPKNNKTLKNIIDAIDEMKKAKCEVIPELHTFVAADVDSKEDESEITIKDEKEEFLITEQNNTDTLVIARLGVQEEYDCEHIVKLLQDRGFLVLNPVQYAAVACDKYETAVLLQKGGIPQPNFTLMTKDILYDEKLFNQAMKEVYKDWDVKDKDKNEEKDLVIKILDGHGGTGVFMSNGKKFYAVLQTIFALTPETQLIIQKKEEADGGDIRVHVLTLNERQVILAAMKRVKLGGDFRSNVSLGATAEKVKLTPEQEQIALKTAKLSKMPWCAVDIMPLVKGSNPELGDNVVLEINASPGTDGISEVIGENFVRVMINQLKDPKEFELQEKIAGYIEAVSIDWGNGFKDYLAKLDTGNGTKGASIEVGEYEEKNKKVTFKVDGKEFTFDIVEHSNTITGDGEEKRVAKRPMVLVPRLKLGLRQINNVRMSIVKSRDKSTNVLLNRNILRELGYVVSPGKTHILTPEMEKIKIV
jgi:RimK family alpha-L-glutamate ligase